MTGKGGRTVIKRINCAMSIMAMERFAQGAMTSMKEGQLCQQPLGRGL
jgi:hypothetical protein